MWIMACPDARLQTEHIEIKDGHMNGSLARRGTRAWLPLAICFLGGVASRAARREVGRVRDGLNRHSGKTGLQPAGFLDCAQGDNLVPGNEERHHHLGASSRPRQVGWDLAEPDADGILIDERPQ